MKARITRTEKLVIIKTGVKYLFQIAWTPYTTPTPLPDRPNWNASDWKNYFEGNHPNFWFKEQLRQEALKKKQSEKASSSSSSNFFKDPLKPQVEEWADWPPEKWIEWSESDEYKDLYTNSKNYYQPSGVEQPDSVPILDHREKTPVISVQWSTPPTLTSQNLKQQKVEKVPLKKFYSKGDVSPPPETYLPPPTQSPTEDPNYVYLGSSSNAISSRRSQLSDIKPEFIVNKKKAGPTSLNSDYIYNNGFESSGLPSAEYSQLSSLQFERFKDRETGAINPSMLLLTQKPAHLKTNDFSLDSVQYDQRPSYQEGSSPAIFENRVNNQAQGSLPAQGSIQDPRGRPPSANNREQQNKFRPRRPGSGSVFQQQKPVRRNPNLPDNSNLSPEVFLPPIDKNNPNFQDLYQNPTPSVNPYFPPNNPYTFPNQYPQQVPVSSSSSTSSGGGGSSAAASASAGQASSSSTSVSEGGSNTNDNKYYECTAAQCPDNDSNKKLVINDDNRNVFIADPTTTTTTTTTTIRTTTRVINRLENITFPHRGQQVNLNIPPGVDPPDDLQEAINRGGTVNLNCDRRFGCPTLIPPEDRSTTTTTAAPAPAFRVSISPLFGNINRGNSEESSSGTDTTAPVNQIREQLLDKFSVDETEELPVRGLGEDYINEVYELESPESSFNNRVASINSHQETGNSGVRVVGGGERVAEIPSNKYPEDDSTAEDLKNIVNALTGLIQLLNGTNLDQGRLKSQSKIGLPPGGNHLGSKRYPVKNIIFDDEATFEFTKSQSLLDGDVIYFNTKKNLPSLQVSDREVSYPSTTIPPHLIPLGQEKDNLCRSAQDSEF